MIFLIVGVVLWSVTHLIPSTLPQVRTSLIGKLGIGPFKGLFAIDILLALFLIIFGWKASEPVAIYTPPLPGNEIAAVLMLVGLVLFVASSVQGNIKRYVRHPQMLGVICWGVAHLLANGDSRSLILFGGLSAWAVLEIIFINRRDGVWEKPAVRPVKMDLITVIAGAAAFAALLYFHARLFGVSVAILG